MKKIQLILFFLTIVINAQKKDTSYLFENHVVYRKVNNVLSFTKKSNTILINDYEKTILYAFISPNHEGSFSISLKNNLPSADLKKLKCYEINESKFIVFEDKSDENFGQFESYKKNFAIKTDNLTSCNTLFKKLKENKLPKIPENVFSYAIFEENFVYLEDLATFDALQYLEIEYDLNRGK